MGAGRRGQKCRRTRQTGRAWRRKGPEKAAPHGVTKIYTNAKMHRTVHQNESILLYAEFKNQINEIQKEKVILRSYLPTVETTANISAYVLLVSF